MAEAPETTVTDRRLEEAPLDGRANGWTGGQYSLFRAFLGLLLVVVFVYLGVQFLDRSLLVWACAAVVGVLSSLLLMVGLWHRVAAVALILLAVSLQFSRDHELGPGLVVLGLVLVLHVLMPPNPFGSWAARGSPDPSGGWWMPRDLQLAAWLSLSLGYIGEAIGLLVYSYQPETEPLHPAVLTVLLIAQCGFGVLCISRTLRPVVWLLMLGVQVFLMFPPVGWGWLVCMLPLHLFVFDPAWIRPASLEGQVITFYDGHCGLCHRAVRFVLSEDRTGLASDFACLGGPTFKRLFHGDEELVSSLPDSMVVRAEDGALLVKSSATLWLMRRLGGLWRVVAWGFGLVPLALRDWCYDFVARNRKRWFPPPEDVCPLVPPRMRKRFLDLEA